MKKTLIAALIAISAHAAIYPQNTVRKNLTPKPHTQSIASPAHQDNTHTTASNPEFTHRAITLKGFNKKTSDTRETFHITNNTTHHISRITIELHYTDIDNNIIDCRTHTIEAELPPKATRKVSIPSFDKQGLYYYHLTPMRRTQGAPFKVKFKLLRYDIAISPAQ